MVLREAVIHMESHTLTLTVDSVTGQTEELPATTCQVVHCWTALIEKLGYDLSFCGAGP